METTSGLGLKLPSDSDFYDVEDMNYNTRKIDQEFQKSINSEQGMHGIRYYESNLEVYNAETEEWEKAAGGGLPPRPVTNVSANNIMIPSQNNKLVVKWSKPSVYDVQIAQYNIYGYIGEIQPTNISQFNLITTIDDYATTEYESNVIETYNYILVASVSTDGVIQEDITQMCKVSSITLPSIGTTLSSMSWDDINKIVEFSDPRNYFSIGDVKTVSINGTNYNVKIYDFYHDDLADESGKAAITFGLANCLTGTNNMNSTNTNVGGWKECARRSALNSTFFELLPSDLRNIIKTVLKKTSAGNQSSTIETTEDKLFFFSEVELFGSTTYSKPGEGTQYPIFTNNSSRVKKLGDSGSTTYWWERSPYASNATYFCLVYTDGSANYSSASYSYGLCFGFCI